MADGNHRSTAGLSVGIAEEDHHLGSGRYRHRIPGVRSAANVGEGRKNGTVGTTIMERLRKMSETCPRTRHSILTRLNGAEISS